jgi:hypothetical protein
LSHFCSLLSRSEAARASYPVSEFGRKLARVSSLASAKLKPNRVLAWNPITAVKPPAVPRYNCRVLDPEQARAFLTAAETSPAEAPLIFAIA